MQNFFGPEFVKMTVEPFVALDLPGSILVSNKTNWYTLHKIIILLFQNYYTFVSKTPLKSFKDFKAYFNKYHFLFQLQTKKGKNEDNRRKVNIMLLSGQRLELTCDTRTICKDVFDMVVAHIGLVEHHLFALATLKGTEHFKLRVQPGNWPSTATVLLSCAVGNTEWTSQSVGTSPSFIHSFNLLLYCYKEFFFG